MYTNYTIFPYILYVTYIHIIVTEFHSYSVCNVNVITEWCL